MRNFSCYTENVSPPEACGQPQLYADDFDFDLPFQLVAQEPLKMRGASRLLRVNRMTGAAQHETFRQFPQLLKPGDVLVLNDTRVFLARLLGRKTRTGGRVELLLVCPVASVEIEEALAMGADGTLWTCLGKSSKRLKAGTCLEFDCGLTAEVMGDRGNGEFQVRFTSKLPTLEAALAGAGSLPLPPYIEREATIADTERYQTIYARRRGSVAAPTAGLHFTPGLLAALLERGVEHVFVTLQVGPGTFLPLRRRDVSKHIMHAEHCQVPEVTAARIRKARHQGGRIVAIGTTVVRTLESFADSTHVVKAGEMDTRLFIIPGFHFRVVDALLTNFHLPKSTLLMLVCAFLGRQTTLDVYDEAVRQGYRFLSYGDAMFIDDA